MFTDRFSYTGQPMRVVFGHGLTPLGEEVRALGISRAVVICTPDRRPLAQMVTDTVGAAAVGILAEAVMHVPAEVVDRCERQSRNLGCDGYIPVGGGSAIGLAKALALRTGAPIIAVPTTYAGSEMTPVWGITEDRVKRTGRDPVVLPRAVVYDPTLTTGLPATVSVASGMNAIAHAVEGLYAPDRSPIVSLMAREGARAMAAALPRLVHHRCDHSARGEALYGAWLCGTVLGATTMSLHHKLCHVLGGTFNLPHAQTHAIVLPHVLAFNAPFAPEMVTALTGVFGDGDPWTALWQLQKSLPMPLSLADLGLQETDFPEVIHQVTANPYHNPRPISRDDIHSLLARAWAGHPPDPATTITDSNRVLISKERS
ncbi:maleylacetate reductase [Rhodococcus sp. JVH1]|uniref:maleylacetate reductase n=1 Tax=Rhodococcus sp. JVH1 TaxID=745408 RepID=UPI00027203AF|nr:maleylacetate reductase [Rhodococcus sp. JVH1]EJI95941.1 maleylacetate reductase [Rhodococcus sp. JVH1]